MNSLLHRFRSLDRDFRLFLLATVFTGLGLAVDNAAFNNYLREVFHLDVAQRTFLEFPRELPGFLTYAFLAALMALGDLRIAAVANVLVGLGMFGLGIIPPEYGIMLMVVFFYSTGVHLFLPLSSSIGMTFAKEGQLGRKLGQIGALNTIALVVGSLILMTLFQFFHPSYLAIFAGGAVCYMAGAVCLFLMAPAQVKGPRIRWIWKKEYSLYYVLSIFFGARKQLFLTFGPWVLVDVFRQPVSYMAFLVFVIYGLGIWVRPWIGRLIDHRGERFVLGAEALLLFGVCLVYAFAPGFLSFGAALAVVSACFVVDQSSSSVAMARATYLRKIAKNPEDVSPTLSLGTTLDHIFSMSIPFVGGLLWTSTGRDGYRWVFLGGAVIALVNWILTRRIRT